MIEKINFNGVPAVQFTAGGYEAIMVPSVGANVVKLKHLATGIEILRTPEADEMDNFKERPQIYGLPLLFPPNRIADGTYTFEGRKYQYPITIPAQNNYHHGIIKGEPFDVSRTVDGDGFAGVEAVYYSNAFNNAIFRDFPHEFCCRMIFRLDADGLHQTTVFENLSDKDMPVGMGFHTPIRVPFTADGKASDYRLRLSVGKRMEMNERTLPTEKLLDFTPAEAPLRTEGIAPCGEAMEWALVNETLTVDGHPYNGAIMTDTASGWSACYEVDENFKYWTFWNNGGNVPYACPEPQSWATNAPNLSDPEAYGFRHIAPGGEFRASTHLFVSNKM